LKSFFIIAALEDSRDHINETYAAEIIESAAAVALQQSSVRDSTKFCEISELQSSVCEISEQQSSVREISEQQSSEREISEQQSSERDSTKFREISEQQSSFQDQSAFDSPTLSFSSRVLEDSTVSPSAGHLRDRSSENMSPTRPSHR
jgi:hypothetical protein